MLVYLSKDFLIIFKILVNYSIINDYLKEKIDIS